jgi:hypothetical protein
MSLTFCYRVRAEVQIYVEILKEAEVQLGTILNKRLRPKSKVQLYSEVKEKYEVQQEAAFQLETEFKMRFKMRFN